MRTTTHWSRSIGAAVLGALLCLPAWAKPTSVQAVWASRHVRFVYQGFTTYYSCDGLRDEITSMLSMLGARHLKVRAQPCSTSVGADPFPGVNVTMQVLVPAEHVKAGTRPVAAHWHTVVLSRRTSSFEDAGRCELLEQFKRTFLPLFTTRKVRLHATCVPHQLNLGVYLSAETLFPDHPPGAAKAHH